MQRLLIVLSLAALVGGCDNAKNTGDFKLSGQLSNTRGETIYLEKLSSPQPVLVDSAIIDEKGHFEFTNYLPHIGFYRIKENQQNFAMLVLDSADKVVVTGNLRDLGNSYKVTGSPETELFMAYNALSRRRDLQLDSLNKVFQVMMETSKADTKKMEALSKEFEGPYNVIVDGVNKQVIDLIGRNTTMFASIMAIQALEPDKYPDVYKALDAGLSKKYPNDKNVRMFHDMVSKMVATTVGQDAPDINLPSPDGTPIALSSLRGKVVLIDFWASWCGPCRKEMPNVVKAYAKFRSKGFEIYGVSLDSDRDRWLEAIQKDGITWPQVSDLKHWGSDAAKLYNVQSIPYTVLVDRQGKIITKNLRGPELEKTLEAVLQ